MQSKESPLFQSAQPTQYGYRDIRPADLRQGVAKGVRVIDVREPAEFTGELGHVPGAELSPLGGIAAAAAGWDREREVLLICRSGGRSARAAIQLVGMGFKRVMNLAGGMMAYNDARLPIER
jgi:rhodanese-related sulfurtransferase